MGMSGLDLSKPTFFLYIYITEIIIVNPTLPKTSLGRKTDFIVE